MPFWKAVARIAEVNRDGFRSWSHFLTVNANIRADYPGNYELRFVRNSVTRKQEVVPVFTTPEDRVLFYAVHGPRQTRTG